MKNTNNENGRKRFKTLILATVSGMLGLALAGTIFALVPTVQTVASSAAPGAAPATSTSKPSNSIALPSSSEIKLPASANDSPTTANGTSGNTSGSNGSSGSKTSTGGTSNTGGGSTGNGGSDISGGSSSNGNVCPETRGENPALWDSCRAGYVAPTVQWGGVLSCTPIDKSAGTWSVTYKWNAVGGNWRGYWEGTGASDGVNTVIVTVNPGEASEEPILLGRYANIVVQDMNGWGWIIDRVYSNSSPYIPMNTVCH